MRSITFCVTPARIRSLMERYGRYAMTRFATVLPNTCDNCASGAVLMSMPVLVRTTGGAVGAAGVSAAPAAAGAVAADGRAFGFLSNALGSPACEIVISDE